VICAGTAWADGKDEEDIPQIPPDAAGGTLQRGVPPSNLPGHAKNNSSGNGNLIDHGGPVLPTSNVYYIWWGSLSVWPGDAYAGLTSLAGGFNGSVFMSDIFPQYMRGAGVSTKFVNSLYDGSTTPPSRGPSTSTIVKEACKVIGGKGLTADPTALYVVLTDNFPHGVNYCAWHSWGSCNGQTIQVAYMPNTTGVTGCNDAVYSCNAYSPGTNSIANVLSHEFSESITDPDGTAWYDNSGNEIGDKCAWTFSACVTLTTGSWQLQREWSNAVHGCIQQ
jgi:hypothetical protein